MFAIVVLGTSRSAPAESVTRSFDASPEIYKVIGEDGHYRIIAASWKPGQRDRQHSHPVAGVYFVTDCHLRGYSPDGKSHEGQVKAGTASVNKPVQSHSVENIGQSECKLVMFEKK
jgi:mannose-6-phosphate isomerase-like protein (cupin superfamily)